MLNNNKDYYSIVDFPEDNKYYGKFRGTVPKMVASKAFSSLIQFIDVDQDNMDGKFIVFVIKNMQNNKMYKYIGTRIRLENPVKVIKKNGIEVEYRYKNVIGKYRPELDKI